MDSRTNVAFGSYCKCCLGNSAASAISNITTNIIIIIITNVIIRSMSITANGRLTKWVQASGFRLLFSTY